MNVSLHSAADDVRHLLDEIDPDTGEMSPEFEQARALVATKSVAVAAYLLGEERQAEMVEQYAADLMARVKASRRRAKWLRDYLCSHMAACGITEIRDERGLFKVTRQPERDTAVEVFDAHQVPADYLREVPAKYEPDKTLIRRAIDDGYEVPGAKLVKRDRLTIK